MIAKNQCVSSPESPGRSQKGAAGKRSKKQAKVVVTKVDRAKATTKSSIKKDTQSNGGVRGQSQSCHQCRQSIHSSKGVSEVKSGRERLKCSNCTRYWCEQCLQNRYGVIKSEQDPTSWVCPVCTNNCNCSLCRKKAGKLATGILTPLVKSAGFGSVSDFLDKGTDDIAKVLQWKSPEIAAEATSTHVKKKRKLESDDEGRGKAKRERKQSHDNSENSTVLANTPPPVPISGYHSDGKAHTGSGKHRNGQRHHGNGRSKQRRRRRLSHPCYSITIEDDGFMESCEPSKLFESATLPPPVPHATVKEESMGKVMNSDGMSTPARSEFKVEANLSGELTSPFRRSQRKRTTTRRYSSLDFRPVSDEEGEGPASPPSKGKGQPKKRVSFKSPPMISPNSTESASNEKEEGHQQSIEFTIKQKELDELRSLSISALREKKVISRHEVRMERAKLRQEAQQRKKEELLKLREERARIKQEKRMKVLASQNLLREARKVAQRRLREREKERKQQELRELKQKRQAEKRKKQLLSTPVIIASREECCSDDDSAAFCETAGLPSLPDLPALDLPFTPNLIPRFLFVSEFLYTFADALGLNRRLTAAELSKLMATGRGLGDLYLSLLQVLVDEDSQLQKQLKPSKRQRDLEQLARSYLHDIGKNGFMQGCSVSEQSLEKSLIILHHLCEEAIHSATVVEYMEGCQEQIDQLRREERQREKGKSKEISEQLKRLCDGGNCSLEDIKEKRREFSRELEEMRRSAEEEQLSYRLSIRNTFLGQDRYDRIYWKLQSFPGVLVEVLSSRREREEGEDSERREEDGLLEGAGDELVASEWLVINSVDVLEQIIGLLHPRGRREGQLLTSLSFHKADITTHLRGASSSQSHVKKFYGSV